MKINCRESILRIETAVKNFVVKERRIFLRLNEFYTLLSDWKVYNRDILFGEEIGMKKSCMVLTKAVIMLRLLLPSLFDRSR